MLLLRAARSTTLSRCLCHKCPPATAILGGAPTTTTTTTPAAAAASAPASAAATAAHSRSFAASAGPAFSAEELAIAAKLRAGLQSPVEVQVVDTSGGCGSMFQITAVAGDFRGKSIVKQHQLVTKILADEIASWHGFQLNVWGTAVAQPLLSEENLAFPSFFHLWFFDSD